MNSIFNKYCKRYDAWYDDNRFAYLSELEALRKVLPEKAKGLEIGVGTGRFAAPLGIAVGIDPSQKMLKLAKGRGVDVRCAFGEDLPFQKGTFDYVALIITLCFVRDPLKVLKESKRVLRKNGKIIIGIVDKDSFLGKYYQNKKSIFYKEAIFFSVKEVTDLLKDTGFSKFSYSQTLYKIPEEIDSVHETRKGFREGGFIVITAEKK